MTPQSVVPIDSRRDLKHHFAVSCVLAYLSHNAVRFFLLFPCSNGRPITRKPQEGKRRASTGRPGAVSIALHRVPAEIDEAEGATPGFSTKRQEGLLECKVGGDPERQGSAAPSVGVSILWVRFGETMSGASVRSRRTAPFSARSRDISSPFGKSINLRRLTRLKMLACTAP
jgi:hypothetical protein